MSRVSKAHRVHKIPLALSARIREYAKQRTISAVEKDQGSEIQIRRAAGEYAEIDWNSATKAVYVALSFDIRRGVVQSEVVAQTPPEAASSPDRVGSRTRRKLAHKRRCGCTALRRRRFRITKAEEQPERVRDCMVQTNAISIDVAGIRPRADELGRPSTQVGTVRNRQRVDNWLHVERGIV